MKRGWVFVDVEQHNHTNWFDFIWDEVEKMSDMKSIIALSSIKDGFK